MAKRTASSETPAADDIKRALATLRPDEPLLDTLPSDDESWLLNAFGALQRIYQEREAGRPDEAFCIFNVENIYVQFVALQHASRLACVAISGAYVAVVAEILGTEGDAALKKLGFEEPRYAYVEVSIENLQQSGLSRDEAVAFLSPQTNKDLNYSQSIQIDSVADLAYATRLLYRTLKQVYKIANITDVKYTINLPTLLNPTEFAAELVRQLNVHGIVAMRKFRIPGTETRLNIYIACPARAFVEIRSQELYSPRDASKLLKQAAAIRREFSIEPILIIIGHRSLSTSVGKEFHDSGFLVLTARGPGPCAESITKLLRHLTYRFMRTDVDFRRIKAQSIAAYQRDLQSSEEGEIELEGGTVSSTLPDIFADVLVSLESVLKTEQFRVLKAELSSFSEEYRHRHYTACGLRIGRMLEYVVYTLATAWGVRVNRTTLTALLRLENSFAQLSRAVIDCSAAAGTAKSETALHQVKRQFEQASKHLADIPFEMQQEQPVDTDVPLNVESIVNDIRRQFEQDARVRDSLDFIIKERILRRILETRNAAAHASTNGEPRELDQSEVDAPVELLRIVLFWFGSIAFAVAEKDARRH